MDLAILQTLNAARTARRAVVHVTEIATGAQRVVGEAGVATDPLAAEIAQALLSGKSGLVATAAGEVFLAVEAPPPRIVVVGAVHISQALSGMAGLAGFDVEIVDPRTAFATPERFPDVSLTAEWPEDVLRRRPLDAYCALVAVTHDPKIDDLPLKAALEARCFYVGALGSRKTHASRGERLTAAGVDAAAVAWIDAPIGLDIGAATPGEIAVAILASIIAAFRRRPVARE